MGATTLDGGVKRTLAQGEKRRGDGKLPHGWYMGERTDEGGGREGGRLAPKRSNCCERRGWCGGEQWVGLERLSIL